jgi:hypothetical protein
VIRDQVVEGGNSHSIHSATLQTNVKGEPPARELRVPDLASHSFLQSLLGKAGASAHVPSVLPNTSDLTYQTMREACADPSWLKDRGPAYTVLPMYSDFIKPPFREVHAIPNREFIASNYTPDEKTEEIYYVNGMRYGPHEIERHLSSLVKTFGKPVTAIINDQESDFTKPEKPGFFKSLWHSACGFLSADAGHAVESSAVGRVEHAINEHMRSGKPLHLIAHSQGSIIVANALERMLGPHSLLSSDEKEKIYALVRISTFGAAEHYFPTRVRVQEYAHRGDAVTQTTAVLADVREWGRDAWNGASVWGESILGFSGSFYSKQEEPRQLESTKKRAPVVYLDGNHDFGPFLEKLPEFFIKKAGGDLAMGGPLVAHNLSCSITSARLSDLMHGLIIREMIHRQNQDFARAFLATHPSGMVGKFHVPFMTELRALAEQ